LSYILDTNIIIYAFDRGDLAKHSIARRILEASIENERPTLRQILGEVLNAAHKKRHLSLPAAREAVALLEGFVPVLPTDSTITLRASEMAERYQLQYFDAVICTVARRVGASILLSEDMQDGLRLGAMTIVNPFNPANADLLDGILA
jgi:predicted nucleic acid-binding protein